MRPIEEDLLNRAISDTGFPPREKVQALHRQWHSLMGACRPASEIYRKGIIATLERFVDFLIANAQRLGLNKDAQFSSVLQEATERLFRDGLAYLKK